jgi:CheY-like chemotaxis protein
MIEGTRRAKVLLAEDSPSDVLLIQEAVKETELPVDLLVVGDGVEAMEFLRRQGKYASAARPDMILLDLNMPRKDGREVLAEVKGDDQLRTIPVIVLTSSSADSDVKKAYELRANGYVAKPSDFSSLKEAVRALEHFWFQFATLPSAVK